MIFSENWLREWVDPQISTQQLAHQLTMAGLEIDGIEPVSPPLDKIVAGRVLSVEPHPDANKLRICRVDVGTKQALQIVCGAANVQAQANYPVALIGTKLPNGLKIKKSKLRGVESQGMLCSAKELGIAESAEGLMSLAASVTPGTGIYDYLQLNDNLIEVSLTPNRGDCLSIAGIAREVGVLNRVEMSPPQVNDLKPTIKDRINIEIAAKTQCTRYVGCIMKNIDASAQTPIWMQEKLRRSGIRSLNPVVDVTNFVLLELGQPMHAFDLARLQGDIQVRMAKTGEKIELLDGQVITIDKNSLVIADEKQAQALAGIMGGAHSAVSTETRDILLESAFFVPTLIASRARHYGLQTDSSHRFERGVDPNLQLHAMNRAIDLLKAIVGGEVGPAIDTTTQEHTTDRDSVPLKSDNIKRVLGIHVNNDVVEDILSRLGMSPTVNGTNEWRVGVPSYRFDIEQEIDLIEEIARIHGYQQIPDEKPTVPTIIQAKSSTAIDVNRFKSTLVSRGYQEAITYSFIDPKLQSLLDPETAPVPLSNPISADMSVMRTSLWAGLLNSATYNINRQQNRVRLFEVGMCFTSAGSEQRKTNELQQDNMLSGLITGHQLPHQWAYDNRQVDFYDLKNDVESLLAYSATKHNYAFVTDTVTALHPGRCAKVVNLDAPEQNNTIGYAGELHPTILEFLGISQKIYLFELKLDAISIMATTQFEEISKFPTIRRDLAIIVDDDIKAQVISDCIINNSPAILNGIQLFDVYRGTGIADDKKSLAYSLTLQDPTRTLKDNEVDAVISEIMSILNKELGATLRN